MAGKPKRKQKQPGRVPKPGARHRAQDRTRVVVAAVTNENDGDQLVVYEIEETGEVLACPLEDWPCPRETEDCEVEHWDDRPGQGSHWQHFRGGTYRVLRNAFHTTDGAHLVIYKSDADGSVWAREISHWRQPVHHNGDMVPRFAEIGDRKM